MNLFLGVAMSHISENRLWRSKFQAFSIHFGCSLAIALLAALLVFGLWYPYPFREISGGRDLFLLIVGVDVVMGPLITLAVFNPSKSRREKILDFSLIGLLQTGALVYGLWAVALARPVHVVFEYDRLRVVHAVDIPAELLDRAPVDLKSLPLTGPTYLSLRPMQASEQQDMMTAAFSGLWLSARPELWQPYAAASPEILQAGRPVAELIQRFTSQQQAILNAVSGTGRPIEGLVYLPVVARKDAFWTAVLDRQDAKVLAYLPIDSF